MAIKLYLSLVLSLFWLFLAAKAFKFDKQITNIYYSLFSFPVLASESILDQKNSQLEIEDTGFYSKQLRTKAKRLDSIARKISVRIDGSKSYGSGVIVDRARHHFYVLTNAHVVDRPAQYQIVTVDGMSHTPRSRVIIPDLDLALLSFESDRNYPVAVIDRGIVPLSTKIHVGGWSRSGGSLRQPIFCNHDRKLDCNQF